MNQREINYLLGFLLIYWIWIFFYSTSFESFSASLTYKISDEEAVENNIFAPNLYKSMLSFAPLREYFEFLNLMLGIVEDLNLDRRILHKAAPN
ncbi:hypothetical protein PQG02_27930 [Nostoc sp. UHCC 0926]|uniref:hypothetical protein n=1 Tax=unclassified Nostoc TaxID=2593658 RepID=UPI00235EF6BD|nr:hypothetical protein [Nostoc sp. UHCC 0926]WDD32443.1 hypothetical protein PQG02_27930 [Nostoc sp. UHCC 0926]